MTSAHLSSEFMQLQPKFVRLQRVIKDQLGHLVETSGLTLGVPIESRIKSWDSIDEKLKRKGQTPLSLHAVEDLLGVRVIFLFQRDLDAFISKIESTFEVHSKEDTSSRLGATKFGYKSQHFIVSAPADWSNVPTMAGLAGLKAEIQIRTLSQHIWAAASHKLQYKHEDGVPEPVRRSIHRVSALLELVDIELGRVLEERHTYIEAQRLSSDASDSLDVSVVETVLDEELPSPNKDAGQESYADLLRDLLKFGVTTRGELQNVLRAHRAEMMASEQLHTLGLDDEEYLDGGEDDEQLRRKADRAARGVFFTHVGLARAALSAAFGEEEVANWLMKHSYD